jgi:hypothetical protein
MEGARAHACYLMVTEQSLRSCGIILASCELSEARAVSSSTIPAHLVRDHPITVRC